MNLRALSTPGGWAHSTRLAASAVIALLMMTASAYAQGSITGTVKDSSGGVLPGVTVEVSSPALIEKVRSTVTGSNGQYGITDLRPGSYVVTFSLPGFNTNKREGIELRGDFAATVNIEMNVGAMEETITVTGETPIVDVRSAASQRVIDKEVIDTIPTGRMYQNLGTLIPGMVATTSGAQIQGVQDVGGASGDGMKSMAIHGGRTGDQTFYLNGISYMSGGLGALGTTASIPDTGYIQEVVTTYSGGSGDAVTGGVNFNLVPREGGDRFSGSYFSSYGDAHLQSSNLDDELRAFGLDSTNRVKQNYEVNPSFGGPIKEGRLWYFTSGRYQVNDGYAGGVYFNKNAPARTDLNPTRVAVATDQQLNTWTYEADKSRPAYNLSHNPSISLRLTSQITTRNKVTFFWERQNRTDSHRTINPTIMPDATSYFEHRPYGRYNYGWSSPITNKFYMDFGVLDYYRDNCQCNLADPRMIPVVEQSTGLNYRAPTNGDHRVTRDYGFATTAKYVTGAHNFKVGFSWYGSMQDDLVEAPNLQYRLSNGVPNQITQRSSTYHNIQKMNADLATFVQDQWQTGRLTLTGGLRYEFLDRLSPAVTIGPSIYTPDRNLSFKEEGDIAWKSLLPRTQAAFDLFGNGRTALKFSAGKYSLRGYPGFPDQGPVGKIATSATRAWTDSNRNYVVDCDLVNKGAQNLTATGGDICGAMSNLNFGTFTPVTTTDPNYQTGWGKRPYNWEFSASVQHQLAARISMQAGYYRRIFGNFMTTDNRAVTAADFDAYSITVPTDPRLPASGETLSGLVDVKPAKFGLVDNFVTNSNEFGKQIEHWNGFDVTVESRIANGLNLQGGLSVGKTITDNCEIAAKLPELGVTAVADCHAEGDLKHGSQAKFLASYTLPKGINVSATFQSLAGPPITTASYAVPAAQVTASLGRAPAGNPANVTINVLRPNTKYGDWLNQLDLRFGKVVRAGRSRTRLSVDLFNALNGNAVQTFNTAYGPAWLTPNTVLGARYVKFSVQFDY